MPRIRKKTSNRVSTNERRKVTNKVRESRKKKKKAAKKNPQWISKTPKDPGIPNNFPFKDQVLAEVSEQRRADAEEKQRKREERRALRSQARGGESFTSGLNEVVRKVGETEELTGLQVGNDAIGGIGAKMLTNVQALKPVRVTHVEDEPQHDVHVLIHRDLPTLRAVLDESDMVIEILDARDPLPFRSLHIEELIASKPGRRTLLLLNKIDTCPRESIEAWAAYLRTQHPTFLFRSATAFLPSGPELTAQLKGKGKAKFSADNGLGVDAVRAYLGEMARAKDDDKPLAVAVLGPTNAGKSSFINSVLRNSVFPIYSPDRSSRGPSTTEVAQETMLEVGGQQIRLIDTPGLVWKTDEPATNAEVRARDILLRSRGRIDRLKDPSMAISHIVSRSSTEDLMIFYSLPAFAKGEPNSFLSGVARSHQLVKKRGELDMTGASRIVLRDWSTGKFPRYTTPPTEMPTPSAAVSTDNMQKFHVDEPNILATCPSRKEMWKNSGLVKLVPGDLEARKVVLDEQWLVAEEQENDEVAKSAEQSSIEIYDDGPHDSLDGDGDEEEAEDDSDNDEAPQKPLPILNKVKRKREIEHPTSRPIKNAVFASASEGRTYKRERKVANVMTRTKRAQNTDDEAYDFSKFF